MPEEAKSIPMTTQPRAQKKRDEIFDACDKIVAEGQTPTVRAILDRLGGSATTATKYLREWKQRSATTKPMGYRLLEDAYQQLWADVQGRVEKAEKRAKAAESEVEKARTEAREAKLRCEQAMIEEEAARQKVANSEEIRRTAELEINIAKAQQKEAERARARAEQAERDAKQLSTALIESTESMGKLFIRIENALQQFDEFSKEREKAAGGDINEWQGQILQCLTALEAAQRQQGTEVLRQVGLLTDAVGQLMKRIDKVEQSSSSTDESQEGS